MRQEHHRRSLLLRLPTTGAEPFAFWLSTDADAGEVEPLDRAVGIIATDHLAVGDLRERFAHSFKPNSSAPNCTHNRSAHWDRRASHDRRPDCYRPTDEAKQHHLD